MKPTKKPPAQPLRPQPVRPQQARPSPQIVILVWTILSGLGWYLIPWMGFQLTEADFMATAPLVKVLTPVVLNGLLLGVVVGISQWIVLNLLLGVVNKLWIIATLAGYTLASGLGWLVAAQVANRLFRERAVPLPDELAVMMVLAGLIVALAQWLGIKPIFARGGMNEAFEWVLGNGLAWGLGFYLAGIVQRGAAISSGLTGVVIGLVGAGLLFYWYPYKFGSFADDRRSRR